MRMTKTIVVAAVALLVGWAGADGPWWSVSVEDAQLDTRTISAVAAAEDKGVDTRTYTVDWSAGRSLNTKKIVGSMLLLR